MTHRWNRPACPSVRGAVRLVAAFVAVVGLAACSDVEPQADPKPAAVAPDDRSAESEPAAVASDRSALHAEFSAQFDHAATSGRSCPVTAVHFTDESAGDPVGWEWTFGDGTTSTEQNPTWKPEANTAMVVTLMVSHGDTKDSITERISTYVC